MSASSAGLVRVTGAPVGYLLPLGGTFPEASLEATYGYRDSEGSFYLGSSDLTYKFTYEFLEVSLEATHGHRDSEGNS